MKSTNLNTIFIFQFQVKCPCVDGPQNLARSSMKQVLEDYHEAIYDLVSSEVCRYLSESYMGRVTDGKGGVHPRGGGTRGGGWSKIFFTQGVFY